MGKLRKGDEKTMQKNREKEEIKEVKNGGNEKRKTLLKNTEKEDIKEGKNGENETRRRQC